MIMYRKGFFANKNADNPMLDDTQIPKIFAGMLITVSASGSDATIIHAPSSSSHETTNSSTSGLADSSGTITCHMKNF
jgi:hypothetical protein